MTDIAKLGLAVDTNSLDKGVASLNKFQSSAKATNASVSSMGNQMNASAKIFAQAILGMNKGIYSLVSSTQGVTQAQKIAAGEAVKYSSNLLKTIKNVDQLAASQNKLAVATKTATTAQKQQVTVANSGGSIGIGLGAKGVARDQTVNRFNTANIAAQFQDVGVTAAMGMSPMTIALQQGTQLSAVLNTMDKPLAGLAQAFTSILNPVSLLTIAFVALGAVWIQTTDWGQVANDVLNGIADSLPMLITGFTGLALAMVALKWSAITAGIASVVTWVSTLNLSLVALRNTFIVTWAVANPVAAIVIGLTAAAVAVASFSKSFRETLKNAVNDVIGFFFFLGDNVANIFKDLGNLIFNTLTIPLRAFNDGLIKTIQLANRIPGIDIDTTGLANLQNSLTNPFGETSYNKSAFDVDYIGKMSDKIKSFTQNVGEASKEQEKWADVIRDSNQELAKMSLDTDMIGKSTYEITKQTSALELRNKAEEIFGKDLATSVTQQIAEQSEKIAEATVRNEVWADSFNTTKDTTHSFFSTMKSGLAEGQSLWESFGNAVTDVLNKITDKMLDIGVDTLFQGLEGFSSANGGKSDGGSFWGGIASGIGSMFSATPNAKGGTFTNGVYNDPQLFKFAKGGSFGVMGEAGPEAVMPLHRGPDGSLGVKADGNTQSAGGNVVVNVINNSDAQASVSQQQTANGMELQVMIDKANAQNISTPGSYTNRSLAAQTNKSLIRR